MPQLEQKLEPWNKDALNNNCSLLTGSSSEKQHGSKATKRSRTNTPTHEDSNADIVGLLKPMDDNDSEDQVSSRFAKS